MAKQVSREEFLQNLSDSGLFSPDETVAALGALPAHAMQDGDALALALAAAGKLTAFQASALRERRLEELVIGNYQVLDRLGAGGMGTVYKAIHRRMKRVVAIKVLSRTFANSDQFIQRFQREVEAVARLSHPNIVMAHDADEAGIGHYLVMEFVNGRDLASAVQQGGPLPVGEALASVIQAARALEYAHGQGIIHRDIKPANLLRDEGGVVKVADLGLARFNDNLGRPAKEVAALTQAGTIMGTADFMSPEQALGFSNLDHRVDIYSLGCTLYFLVTGQPPYEAPTIMALLLKHREAPIPSLAARGGVPIGLDVVFRKMVAKNPEARFGSMAEVIRALEAIELPPAARPTAAIPTAQTIALQPAVETATGGQNILLVEPSRSQAVIIRKYLQELGHADVPLAQTGQKALELARTVPPGVVLSAMHLLDMTGMQLAQKIQAEPRLSSTRFVLITSQADAHQAHLESLKGSIALLHKPFDRERLAQTLAAASQPVPRKVLVVDDSAAARTHIRSVLAGLGLRQIVEAGDGAEAVALLERETFDLVVADYNMPRLDGRGLLDFIRHRSTRPAVPVIVVTTETDPDKLDALRQLGVSAICAKSFKPEIVRAIIDKLG